MNNSRLVALLVIPVVIALLASGGLVMGEQIDRREIDRRMLAYRGPASRWQVGVPRMAHRGLYDRPRVGLQVGHWRMEEMPDELARLRDNTGARWRDYTEGELNLKVATAVADRLRARGVTVDLLPGRIPPGYEADAFVSIHADGAWRPGARGWKISTPWRTSDSSRRLMRALAEEYSQTTGLPEDRYGITYNMKGYYAFSYHRFRHAISPHTPAVIIEMGFVTHPADRLFLYERTDVVVEGIVRGIQRFLDGHTFLDWRERMPTFYARRYVAPEGARLLALPSEDSFTKTTLEPGTPLIPVHTEPGWVEVIVRGNYRSFGWLRETDVR